MQDEANQLRDRMRRLAEVSARDAEADRRELGDEPGGAGIEACARLSATLIAAFGAQVRENDEIEDEEVRTWRRVREHLAKVGQ